MNTQSERFMVSGEHDTDLQNAAQQQCPGVLVHKEDIVFSNDIIHSWQSIVNTLAELVPCKVAVIMKLDDSYLEVCCVNTSSNHPYEEGGREPLYGRYHEEAITSKQPLRLPSALHDARWKACPEISLGLISCLVFPLCWPDGDTFGTISVLDSKEHFYNSCCERLVEKFQELVQTQLALQHRNITDKTNLENILDSLTDGIIAHDVFRRIDFFNRSAESITGFRREDVLGKDCHDVFNGPFCGGRCSFQDETSRVSENLYYPLNIVSHSGEPRRIEMSVRPRAGDNGQPAGVIASFRDVTDLISLKIQAGNLKGFAGIIGRDRKMLQIYRQIRNLATNDYPVCITGETGTGKELVAQAIHNESRRGGGPFVPVNCAALPEGVLESELFGHVRGAFTGATRDKKGRFELADGGTLFLDEVGDLPGLVQAKLLRVLQEGTFERVGDEKTIAVNLRIISATNRDLKRMVEKGRFRDDLFYRLSVVPVELPPIRRRKVDISLLVEHFLGKAREEGQTPSAIAQEAMDLLVSYPWPGNVRELQSAVRFALVSARGRTVKVEHLPLELKQWARSRPSRGPGRKLDLESVRSVLLQCGGNKAKAARLLGVGRATLYRFLADFVRVS